MIDFKKNEEPSTERKRITLRIDSLMHEQIKIIAYNDRMKIQDIVRTAFGEYLVRYVNKYGVIQKIEKIS